MSYTLLTGATGLLGNYLLRDLLLAGRQVAVVARSNRMESARQRIESQLAAWEEGLGHALPRPPVLDGDICQPDFGLSGEDVAWVARHCRSMLHNAASLSFEENEKTGEPRRSNVEGTRNALELCRRTKIRDYHQVSTAYVCGLRTGRVLETELNVGQTMGNAYEQSKIESETMVVQASFLDAHTIYRPAIIIGDSRTGYTTTYHGFYAPLKILFGFVDWFDPDVVSSGMPLMELINLSPDDRKSYVPVDWVARAIVYLNGRDEHHGRVYHLTPEVGTPVSVMCEAVEQGLAEYLRGRRTTKPPRVLDERMAEQIGTTFLTQMETYRAYWRDDPQFDRTNFLAAAPDLAPLVVDRDMLLRMARCAYETNFGWPKPQPKIPRFDVQEYVRAAFDAAGQSRAADHSERIGLQVNGPGGGQWTLRTQGGKPCGADLGLSDDRRALFYLNSRTFERCAQRKLTLAEARRIGGLCVEGDDTGFDAERLFRHRAPAAHGNTGIAACVSETENVPGSEPRGE